MAIRTVEKYIESIRDDREVYFGGCRIGDVTQHPILKAGLEPVAIDYRIAQDSTYEKIATVQSERLDARINRYFHPPRTSEELLLRRELIQLVSRQAFGVPPINKVGIADAMIGLLVALRKTGLESSLKRLEGYFDWIALNDLSLAACITDVKGDRSLRPSEQHDPDLYLRIVERRDDGIIVRGAKVNITCVPFVNEIFVLPTRSLQRDEKDYAVSFAVPVATPGIKIICKPFQLPDELEDSPVSARVPNIEATVIFDDVFVPWERVFLWGQDDAAGLAANTFANIHRFTADNYKIPLIELMLGTASLMADYNGIADAGHVKDKIARLAMYLEVMKGLTLAAAVNCRVVEGVAIPDPAISNAAKFYFADSYHLMERFIQDLAGGVAATAPSMADLKNPHLKGYLEKYYAGRAGVSGGERLRLLALIRDLTASNFSGWLEILAIHAEGTLEHQKLAMLREVDLEKYKNYVKKIVLTD